MGTGGHTTIRLIAYADAAHAHSKNWHQTEKNDELLPWGKSTLRRGSSVRIVQSFWTKWWKEVRSVPAGNRKPVVWSI